MYCSSLFFNPSRWTWRWPCRGRGKIRRSRCLCSGCLWSVFRCCSKLFQVTLTRSLKIPCRLWMSSHGICLPWGTHTHHLCLFTNAHLLTVNTFHFLFFCISQFPAVLCHPDQILLHNIIAVFDALLWSSNVAMCNTLNSWTKRHASPDLSVSNSELILKCLDFGLDMTSHQQIESFLWV